MGLLRSGAWAPSLKFGTYLVVGARSQWFSARRMSMNWFSTSAIVVAIPCALGVEASEKGFAEPNGDSSVQSLQIGFEHRPGSG
jgi:hypothetical protein